MKKSFLLSTLYFLLATFLTGCATVPRAAVPGLKETVRIGGTKYVSAQRLCEVYNLDYHWDPITKKATLTKDDNQVKVMADSFTVLVNDNVRTMDKEAKFHGGIVVIPQAFAYKTIAPLFREEYIERRIRAPRVGLPIKTVIIDPGHGGKDPGAIGKNGLQEKDVVLDIATRLKRKLNAAGINVILTRKDDTFVSLAQRSKIANSQEADFFISIHANASRSRWVSGVEVFYLSESIDDDLRALKAAENYDLNLPEKYSGKHTPAILWDLVYRDNRRNSIYLASVVCKSLCKNLYQRDRGIKPARFYVLKGTNIPAILVEVGFISNPREEKRLENTPYRDKIAGGLVEGVNQYNREFAQTRTVRQ